jgi:putative hemolysin
VKQYHDLSYARADDPILTRIGIRTIEKLTGKPKLQRLYNELQDSEFAAHEAWNIALDRLEVGLDLSKKQLQQIPAKGPVVLIANHPFGVVDGLILCKIIAEVRNDWCVLVNSVFCDHDPRIRQHLLPVDFAETKEASHVNLETRQKALDLLRKDGCIVIFPAGGVATAKKGLKRIEELEWKNFLGKIIKRTQPTIVPIYVHGKNSIAFQLASKISLSLRLSLLLYEVKNKMGKTIKVTIGDPIPGSTLSHLKSKKIIEALKEITVGLSKE